LGLGPSCEAVRDAVAGRFSLYGQEDSVALDQTVCDWFPAFLSLLRDLYRQSLGIPSPNDCAPPPICATDSGVFIFIPPTHISSFGRSAVRPTGDVPRFFLGFLVVANRLARAAQLARLRANLLFPNAARFKPHYHSRYSYVSNRKAGPASLRRALPAAIYLHRHGCPAISAGVSDPTPLSSGTAFVTRSLPSCTLHPAVIASLALTHASA
jgi:hypothetical protein